MRGGVQHRRANDSTNQRNRFSTADFQGKPSKKKRAAEALLKIISKAADYTSVDSHEVIRVFRSFWDDESGQDLIEYCLLLAFVALCAVGLLTGMRTSVMGLWTSTNTALISAQSAAS
jgi:Flp pilus assembly pilin Flp